MQSALIVQQPRLLTTAAARSYAAVSTSTLYRAARGGGLHPVRLGRRLTRWDKADLDAWIAQATTATEPTRLERCVASCAPDNGTTGSRRSARKREPAAEVNDLVSRGHRSAP